MALDVALAHDKDDVERVGLSNCDGGVSHLLSHGYGLPYIGFGNCEVAQLVVTGAKVIKSINTKILYPLVELLRVLATC